VQTPITPPPQTSILLLEEEVEVDSILIWNSAGVEDWGVMILVLTRDDVVQSTHTIFVYIVRIVSVY
jgi:hypothetical protein